MSHAEILASPSAGHLLAAARFHNLAIERGQQLGYVYFIQAENGGPIKIGWSLREPDQQRLERLQTGNPERLRVLGVLQGFSETERELQERFASERLRGEWFTPHPELLQFIARLGNDLLGWEQLVFEGEYDRSNPA